jgi:DNA modification methylase
LSEIFLRQSSVAGDLLVDPFMGSGSSGVAALTLGRRFAGNDVSSDSLKLARERLLLAGGVEGSVIVRPERPPPLQQRLALG